MGGRAEPPEGTPEGGTGGEDEFRSVVFDESFVRAARIQELSATERMSAGSRPIRQRGVRGGVSRQALALMLLIAVAFSAAVYLGTKHPYPQPGGSAAELSISVVPLQPGPGGIPTLAPTASGSTSASPSASASAASVTPSPAQTPDPPVEIDPQEYASGHDGLVLPYARNTTHFTQGEVLQALGLAQTYLEESSLDPAVLTGGHIGRVRDLLAPGQHAQFNQSFSTPVDDRRHEATGWLVRFDTAQVQLAPDQPIRVRGSFAYHEQDDGTLELTSDHTFIYPLIPVAPASAKSSARATGAAATLRPTVLFTVRREITYQLTADDLNADRIELSDSVTEAGPMACDAQSAAKYLTPVLPSAAPTGQGVGASAGNSPSTGSATTPAVAHGASGTPTVGVRPVGAPSSGAPSAGSPGPTAPLPSSVVVDPYDQSRPAWSVCGVLGGPTP